MIVLFYRFKYSSMTSRSTIRRESASIHPYPSPSLVSIVLGAQWGDEVRKN